jgi:hypothetical protein
MKEKLMKIIYEDDGKTKVVKGFLISQDEFTITIETQDTKTKITLGKRGLIKMATVGDLQ